MVKSQCPKWCIGTPIRCVASRHAPVVLSSNYMLRHVSPRSWCAARRRAATSKTAPSTDAQMHAGVESGLKGLHWPATHLRIAPPRRKLVAALNSRTARPPRVELTNASASRRLHLAPAKKIVSRGNRRAAGTRCVNSTRSHPEPAAPPGERGTPCSGRRHAPVVLRRHSNPEASFVGHERAALLVTLRLAPIRDGAVDRNTLRCMLRYSEFNAHDTRAVVCAVSHRVGSSRGCDRRGCGRHGFRAAVALDCRYHTHRWSCGCGCRHRRFWRAHAAVR